MSEVDEVLTRLHPRTLGFLYQALLESDRDDKAGSGDVSVTEGVCQKSQPDSTGSLQSSPRGSAQRIQGRQCNPYQVR